MDQKSLLTAGNKNETHRNVSRTEALTDDLTVLMEDGDSTDIEFVLGPDGVRIYAHKVIIWARCRTYQTKYEKELFHPSHKHLTVKQPRYDPDIFKIVLKYIYTGSITIVDSMVFELLALAQDLGLTQLSEECTTHLLFIMNTENVCYLYNMCMILLNAGNFDQEYRDTMLCKLIQFIGENANECVLSQSWLELSSDAMVGLFSSDMFVLEEAEVWRAAIRWACYQGKCNIRLETWDDAVRERIKYLMEPLIPYIRFLLIESKIFAKEVEPTRIIPNEILLERYKLAAIPTRVWELGCEMRLQPRIVYRLFRDTEILSNQYRPLQRYLAMWYGNMQQEWRLLCRGSRDGFTGAAFHQLVDGYAPTYTIIQGTNGNIAGGYSDVPWDSTTKLTGRAKNEGKFNESNNAFLFSLVNKEEFPPMQFPIQQPAYAVCSHPDYGPTFGAGPDIMLASNCNTNNASRSRFPHTYTARDMPGSMLMGDVAFAVHDYEVYTLRESVSSVVQGMKGKNQ